MKSAPAPVIGVVGGIGSGKSEVARALGRAGFVVADSDAMAREILRRPAVREELVGWWGEGILGADGEVDRAAVARIVFGDEGARRCLEGLVHPLIHAERGVLVEKARRAGAPGVVIDAPLLFEAGVDRECDAVIFVEAPWETRAERVLKTRGWNEEELRRREAAQMPVNEKKRRSRFVVNNSGSIADVEMQVRSILERLRAEWPRTGEGEPRM
jgi:dephospho-CoA kinase